MSRSGLAERYRLALCGRESPKVVTRSHCCNELNLLNHHLKPPPLTLPSLPLTPRDALVDPNYFLKFGPWFNPP